MHRTWSCDKTKLCTVDFSKKKRLQQKRKKMKPHVKNFQKFSLRIFLGFIKRVEMQTSAYGARSCAEHTQPVCFELEFNDSQVAKFSKFSNRKSAALKTKHKKLARKSVQAFSPFTNNTSAYQDHELHPSLQLFAQPPRSSPDTVTHQEPKSCFLKPQKELRDF